MTATVTNHGASRTIPTRSGPFFMAYLRPYKVRDEGILEDLESFNRRQGVMLSVRRHDDLASKHISELRKMAAGRGIKGSFFMRKEELVEKLR